jgi:predicted metal-dependent hydrolase
VRAQAEPAGAEATWSGASAAPSSGPRAFPSARYRRGPAEAPTGPTVSAPGPPVNGGRPDGVARLRPVADLRRYGATVDPEATAAPRVEVRRSRRRRRTVTAYREAGGVVVLLPARFSLEEEREWVGRMLRRREAQDRRRRPGDDELSARAADLSARYLGGRARPASVRWAANQTTRWGSTTPADGSVRVSTRLRGVPGWVLDYVLLHELAHLLEPGHGPQFWALLEAYPRTERARGWLEGFAAGRDLPFGDEDDAVDDAGEQDPGG